MFIQLDQNFVESFPTLMKICRFMLSLLFTSKQFTFLPMHLTKGIESCVVILLISDYLISFTQSVYLFYRNYLKT